ncbi:hypothetical protein ACSS6W_002034 [Trichoderma asperelloides]
MNDLQLPAKGILVVRGQKLEGRLGLDDVEMRVRDEGVFTNTVERYAYGGRDDAMRPGGCSHGMASLPIAVVAINEAVFRSLFCDIWLV